jgi:Ca2+-transporting ATPase
MMTKKIGDRILPYQGLTLPQVEINRQKYGNNIITPPERDPWWKLYLEKFADPVIRILLVAAFVSIIVGFFEQQYAEAIGIIVAILLATTLAFINEYQAAKEFNILNQVYDQVKIKVIREGAFTTIPRQDLVVGDIIYLEQGEEIPADALVLEAVSLHIDQSKITGECEPVSKFTREQTTAQHLENSTYPPYNVYRSTIVDQGHGLCEIIAVGDNTEMGKISQAINTVENEQETPLNLQLDQLSKLIGVIGFGVAVLIFTALLIRSFITGELTLTLPQWYCFYLLIINTIIVITPIWLPILEDAFNLFESEVNLTDNIFNNWLVSLSFGVLLIVFGLGIAYPFDLLSPLPNNVIQSLITYFMVAVTIIVVAVPEGLAMSVTLSLAYSMKKMAASNNLVRKMHACETIGAATVICSDKTGTLTCNQMRIHQAHFQCLQCDAINGIYDCQGLVAEAIAANSTADLEKKENKPPSVIGNATEGALLLWLNNLGVEYIAYRNKFQDISQITFSSEKKYMGTIGYSPIVSSNILHIKGAPEVVLNRCQKILTPEGIQIITDRESILQEIETYQKRGMRTLAFAYHILPPGVQEADDLEDLDNDLIWLGYVAIIDPLREEVSQAIHNCLTAGINIKVVTGDSPETAEEIAHQIGLLLPEETQHNQYVSLTGSEFNSLNEIQAKEAVKSLKVLSRACPLDKFKLVQLLQENGEVVAVTGDGTNDAAALKRAQVGLAMGSGTAIAKEASDIILLDDSFASIVNAVIWGRSLYENIQRFILFQLTINVVALGIAFLGPFIGIELPLTVTQMLWVNLIMDTFAALALATEPPHLQVMKNPPRDPNSFIISDTMGKNIAITGGSLLLFFVGFLLYLRQDGGITIYELSIFFAVFVLLQFWNLFNARCLGLTQSALSGIFDNKAFVAIASTILIGQILIIQFGGNIFRTVPLSISDWLWIISSTSIILWIGEIYRYFQRKTLS